MDIASIHRTGPAPTGRSTSLLLGRDSDVVLRDLLNSPEPSRDPATDLVRRILAQVHTRIGRLAFLVDLRDPLTGKYAHPALVDNFGAEAADRALSHAHHQVFMEWLRFNLADQKADVEEYLRVTRTTAASLPYRELAPASAHEVERQLYLTDFEVVVQMISFEPAAASARDASRPR